MFIYVFYLGEIVFLNLDTFEDYRQA